MAGPMLNMNDCAHCYHWHKDTSTCRRHAPEALMQLVQIDNNAITKPLSAWPETKADDWCGDYETTRKYLPRNQ